MRAFHENRKTSASGNSLFRIHQSDDLCFQAHWHEDVEILLVTDGEMTVHDQSGSHMMQADSLAVFGSGDHHAYQTVNSSRCIILIFSAVPLGNRIWPNGIRFSQNSVTAAAVAENPDKLCDYHALRKIIIGLLKKPQSDDDINRHLTLSDLHQLCGLLLRILPTAPWSEAEEKQLNSRLIRLQSMLERVEAQYRKEITAQEMARQLNLSYHHFARQFTAYVGMGFQEYVNSKRLMDADDMLSTTDLSITEIAYKCGFNSLRTFNRLYRSTYRCSPSARR